MKRLTKRNLHGIPYYPECFNKCAGEGPSIKCHCCYFEHEIIIKLADYEDLEEQGRLIILPCKPNETVWSGRTKASLHKCFYASKSSILSDLEDGYAIGKTKAEAEKALVEMEK